MRGQTKIVRSCMRQGTRTLGIIMGNSCISRVGGFGCVDTVYRSIGLRRTALHASRLLRGRVEFPCIFVKFNSFCISSRLVVIATVVNAWMTLVQSSVYNASVPAVNRHLDMACRHRLPSVVCRRWTGLVSGLRYLRLRHRG